MTRCSLVLALLLAGCPPKQPPEDVTAGSGQSADGGTHAGTSADPRLARMALERRISDAVALLTTDRPEDARKALELLEGLQAEVPASAALAYDIGLAHEQLGNLALAGQSYQQATSLDPTLAVAWLRRGFVAEAQGRLTDALGWYRQGISRAPEDMDLRVAELATLLRLGKHGEAEAAAKAALAINANSLQVYANLGLVYMEQGRLELASFIFRRAMELEGGDTDANLHAFLGRVYFLKGLKSLARQELDRALELDPDLVPALVYLSEYHLENHAYGRMAPLLEHARKLAPEEPAVHMNLGIAYRGLGRHEEARVAYETVLRLAPGRAEPYLNLAILFGDHLKSYEDAIRVLGQYKQAGGGDVATADAWIEEFQKEKERAEKLAERRRRAEEARKKREEEERFLREFESRKEQEGSTPAPDGAAPEQPPAGEVPPPAAPTSPGADTGEGTGAPAPESAPAGADTSDPWQTAPTGDETRSP